MHSGSTVSGHLPQGVTARFRDVVPIGKSLGTCGGHELIVLSLERWADWTDVRFARVDHQGTHRLARRVPPVEAWHIWRDDREMEVIDAVGRGDRAFSNGEVRLSGSVADGTHLNFSVTVASGQPALTGQVHVPASA